MRGDEVALHLAHVDDRLIFPKAMQTKQSDKEFYGRAGRKWPQAVDRQVVKLPELVDNQGKDGKEVTQICFFA